MIPVSTTVLLEHALQQRRKELNRREGRSLLPSYCAPSSWLRVTVIWCLGWDKEENKWKEPQPDRGREVEDRSKLIPMMPRSWRLAAGWCWGQWQSPGGGCWVVGYPPWSSCEIRESFRFDKWLENTYAQKGMRTTFWSSVRPICWLLTMGMPRQQHHFLNLFQYVSYANFLSLSPCL